MNSLGEQVLAVDYNMKTKTEFVPRVNQLDALQLDKDIARIIRDQVIGALQNIYPGLLNHITPEIDLLIRAAIWNYSVRLHSATFGQRLLFICYDKDHLFKNGKIHKHFLLNVLLKYIGDNIAFRCTEQLSLQRFVTYCENFIAFCSLLNFFRFLNVGQRPSLIDYVLGLDNISMYGNRRRELGYSHMTRELIWGGFMELLGFTLPLINYHYVKRKFRSAVDFVSGVKSTAIDDNQIPVLTLSTVCSYCDERPTLPYHIGCAHVFCYYCVKGNVMADSDFKCPACQQKCSMIKAL